MTAPLAGLSVVEFSGDVAVRYCGKLFAAHGAHVLQIHTPDDGYIGYGGPASAAYAAWLDAGKKREAVLPGGIRPDIVIAGQTPAEVARAEAALRDMPGEPLLLALTWFGTSGPCANWHGSDAIIQAMTGVAYAIGPVDGPPVLPQGHAPQVVAGATALIATLAAQFGRRADHPACRPARRVDVSVLEAHMCFSEHAAPGFAAGGPVSRRRGVNRYFPVYPQTVFPAADGWIGVTALTPQQWVGLCDLIGLPELARDPRYATTDLRMAAARELDAILGPALERHPAAWLLEEGQKRRVPLAPVPTMVELLETPHWQERGSFQAFRAGRGFTAPGMPFRLYPRGPSPEVAPDATGEGPLGGLRVLDLSMGWSGPLTGRHFADLGADVIKVEGCAHIDWWRGWNALESGDPPPYETRANFNAVNRNKSGIALDLTKPAGADLLRHFAASADLLIENYAPGVLNRLGFSAEALSVLNPRLVYVSMGAFGSAGRWSGFRAYGSTTEQAAGMPFLHGEADWPPTMQHTAYGDPVAGVYATVAALIALYGREITGGTTIDLSQVECLFQLAADGIIAQSVKGAPPPRTGNQNATSAWRGCVRCAGEDAWIAVDLHDPSRLSRAGITAAGDSRDAIGAALSAWAATRQAAAAAEALQQAGIAAGPVTPAHALLEDPQLNAAGFWRRTDRRYVGSHVVPKPPYAIDGRSPPLHRPAPTLGEHNAAVLTRVAGLTPAEIAALERDGIIGTNPV